MPAAGPLLLAVLPEAPEEPWLLLGAGLELPWEPALLEELLEELEELLEELLDDGLGMLGEGRDALGGVGICGCVGVLALGQPTSSRHRPPPAATVAALRSSRMSPVRDVIGSYHLRGIHRDTVADPRAEQRAPQAAHDVICLRIVCRVLVQPFHVDHPAVIGHAEL